jgi:hypothetical protein
MRPNLLIVTEAMSDQENGPEAYHLFNKAQTVDPEVRAHVYSLVTAVSAETTIEGFIANVVTVRRQPSR